MRRLLVFMALFVGLPAGSVTIDWVYVGSPGNPADETTNCLGSNCGSVPYSYYVSKYEIANTQYAEFLNAKAASDPFGLYGAGSGIDRSGVSGSYTYTVRGGFENRPAIFLSFYSALRFANWLNNGQGSGDTETGAYTITAAGIASNTITRNPGAITFLTSENEWYKAAYYSPSGVYFDYPTGTDTEIGCTLPGSTPNTANCNFDPGSPTNVGSYTGSPSPYGTFDQGGNVAEWTEQPDRSFRQVRGGVYDLPADRLIASFWFGANPTGGYRYAGFRIATLVPEPGTGTLLMTGLLGLAARRQRRGHLPCSG